MAKKIKYDRIGITGSTGFIGSNLVAYFKKQKINCIPFKGNLLNSKDIEKYFNKYKINQVIHLVGGFHGDFAELVSVNLLTTQNLLEFGVKNGLKKIIYSSSGAVYGEPLHKTGSKETDPLRPNTLYGLSKRLTEECLEFYSHEFKITAVILRLSNVYGPGQQIGVIADFLNDIKKRGAITIAGDGSQTRNFIHVSDTNQTFEKALYYNQSDFFNISNPLKISINNIADLLAKKYKFVRNYKAIDNNLKNLSLNIDKATKTLKFALAYKNLRF